MNRDEDDSMSQISRSSAVSKRRQHFCGICGTDKGHNWHRHWKTVHPGLKPFESGMPNPNQKRDDSHSESLTQIGRNQGRLTM
jgi:hypothetical protein